MSVLKKAVFSAKIPVMRHSTQQIFRSTVWYTSAIVGQKILSFFYFYLVSSQLAPETLGAYIWMLSIVSLAGVGTDMGMLQLLTREAAQSENEAIPIARTVLGIKIPLLALTLAVMWIVVTVGDTHGVYTPLLAPASILLTADTISMVMYGLFRSRQLVWVESIGIVLFQSVIFASGVFVLWTQATPLLLMSVVAVGGVVNMLYLLYMCRRSFGIIPLPDLDYDRAGTFLRRLPAFTLTNVFQRIYNTADTVLLGRLATAFDVGIYAVPAKVTTALQTLVPGAFATAIYPSLSHYAKHAREKVDSLFAASFSYVLMLVLPMSVALFVMADVILNTLWPQYTSASVPFRIMVAVLPAVFLAYPTGSLLNAIGQERRASIHRGVVTVANITVNILLIPRLGVRGAAIAFVVANMLLLSLDLWVVAKSQMGALRLVSQTLVRLCVAAAVMGAVLYIGVVTLEDRIHGALLLGGLVTGGVVVYGFLLWVMRVVTKGELQHALRLLRGKGETV